MCLFLYHMGGAAGNGGIPCNPKPGFIDIFFGFPGVCREAGSEEVWETSTPTATSPFYETRPADLQRISSTIDPWRIPAIWYPALHGLELNPRANPPRDSTRSFTDEAAQIGRLAWARSADEPLPLGDIPAAVAVMSGREVGNKIERLYFQAFEITDPNLPARLRDPQTYVQLQQWIRAAGTRMVADRPFYEDISSHAIFIALADPRISPAEQSFYFGWVTSMIPEDKASQVFASRAADMAEHYDGTLVGLPLGGLALQSLYDGGNVLFAFSFFDQPSFVEGQGAGQTFRSRFPQIITERVVADIASLSPEELDLRAKLLGRALMDPAANPTERRTTLIQLMYLDFINPGQEHSSQQEDLRIANAVSQIDVMGDAARAPLKWSHIDELKKRYRELLRTDPTTNSLEYLSKANDLATNLILMKKAGIRFTAEDVRAIFDEAVAEEGKNYTPPPWRDRAGHQRRPTWQEIAGGPTVALRYEDLPHNHVPGLDPIFVMDVLTDGTTTLGQNVQGRVDRFLFMPDVLIAGAHGTNYGLIRTTVINKGDVGLASPKAFPYFLLVVTHEVAGHGDWHRRHFDGDLNRYEAYLLNEAYAFQQGAAVVRGYIELLLRTGVSPKDPVIESAYQKMTESMERSAAVQWALGKEGELPLDWNQILYDRETMNRRLLKTQMEVSGVDRAEIDAVMAKPGSVTEAGYDYVSSYPNDWVILYRRELAMRSLAAKHKLSPQEQTVLRRKVVALRGAKVTIKEPQYSETPALKSSRFFPRLSTLMGLMPSLQEYWIDFPDGTTEHWTTVSGGVSGALQEVARNYSFAMEQGQVEKKSEFAGEELYTVLDSIGSNSFQQSPASLPPRLWWPDPQRTASAIAAWWHGK